MPVNLTGPALTEYRKMCQRRCSVCQDIMVIAGAWCADCRREFRELSWKLDQLCAVLWPRKNNRAVHYPPKRKVRLVNQSLQNAADAAIVRRLLGDELRWLDFRRAWK